MDIESQELIQKRNRSSEFLRWVPVMGLTISFYSALFSTFILYPWHLELSREFESMKQVCTRSKL